MPRNLKAYYNLTKPGIIYGNLLTAAGGFLLASKGVIDVRSLLATLAGISLIIASGCVFNNYIDRGIDKKMARTRKRALVSGLIPARNALIYGTVLGCSGVLILSLWTNLLVVCIGLTAWFFYVVLYGIAKRRSVHGTLVGTIPGAAAPIAGYVAVSNRLDTAVLILFMIMVFWQMPHFYAIAMYRFKDYRAAGLPVLPVKKGMKNTKIQILSYIFAFIVAIILLGIFGYAGWVYLAVMVSLAVYWFWLGIKGFSKLTDDTLWARQMFLFSLIIITAMSAMLTINAWLPGKIIYNLSMLVFIHALIALGSLGYATYLFISPAKSRFSVAYTLVAMTLASGTYLVVSTGSHLLQACTTGLLYLGFVSAVIISARRKLVNIDSRLD